MNKLIVSAVIYLLLAAQATFAQKALTPKWQQVAPGVWKAQIGKPESLTLLGAAGINPAIEAPREIARTASR